MWINSIANVLSSIYPGIVAWKIPRTAEPAGYHPWGHEESDMTEYARAPFTLEGGNVLLKHDFSSQKVLPTNLNS